MLPVLIVCSYHTGLLQHAAVAAVLFLSLLAVSHLGFVVVAVNNVAVDTGQTVSL